MTEEMQFALEQVKSLGYNPIGVIECESPRVGFIFQTIEDRDEFMRNLGLPVYYIAWHKAEYEEDIQVGCKYNTTWL